MSEICMHCGKSVSFGSGNFVNRVPNCDNYEDRLEMNVEYPEGEYSCANCERKYYDEHPQFECLDCGYIDYIESGISDNKCGSCKGVNWRKLDNEFV